jgi:hypothetical protein
MFTGMMPASEKVTPPMGFSPPREDSSSPPSGAPQYHTDIDLDTRTVEALREWEQILLAFEEIKNHFGPDFEPLGADIYPTQQTPYGPATHYRTYSIAGIWMNYYMGLIVLHRAHPTMPPVAMLAAGMSAKTTMPWAFELGRIAAGLEENITHLKVVSTLMGAALIESAFPLFVAGVQVSLSSAFSLTTGDQLSPHSTGILPVVRLYRSLTTLNPRTVPRRGATPLADPPPARHRPPDGVAVGAPNRRRLRVGVVEVGPARPGTAVQVAVGPRRRGPGREGSAEPPRGQEAAGQEPVRRRTAGHVLGLGQPAPT